MSASKVHRMLSKIKHRVLKEIDILQFVKYLEFWNRRNVYVIGTPMHTNVGDNAIAYAELMYLEKCGIPVNRIKEITISEYEKYEDLISRHVNSRKRLIFMHGGGNMGNQWYSEELFRRKVMAQLSKNPIIIFPQTFFYTSDSEGENSRMESVKIYNKRSKLTITAREKISWELMHKTYPDARVILTPDIVLSIDPKELSGIEVTRKGIVFMMRSDGEQLLTEKEKDYLYHEAERYGYSYRHTDMITELVISKDNRKEIITDKMKDFKTAELVITDRLHAMVFAAISGTPCIVLTNNNHKIMGTYEWIKDNQYIRFADNVKDAALLIPKLASKTGHSYDYKKLEQFYKELQGAIERYRKGLKKVR